MGSGGRAARALRYLLLFVMALAAVEYLFGSILEVSPLRSYLYMPAYNASATQTTVKTRDKSSASWPKRLPATASETSNHNTIPETAKNTTILKKVLLRSPSVLVNKTVTTAIVPEKGSKPVESTTSLYAGVEKSEKSIEALKNSTIEAEQSTKKSTELPLCDEMPPNLGPISANKTEEISLEWVETKYAQVSPGGMYKPLNCTARHKVAIIVAFRDRHQHLAMFLNHMHPFLMKQQLDYGIFIVEQLGRKDFNRAKLFNVGFVESQKARPDGWQCFIFHDVDLLPMDERNMYSCPRQPRHMSAAIDKYKYKLPYDDLFGGVSALTLDQFQKVNGFSNRYWGWGGEDDDMSYRIKKSNYYIARYKMSIARYTMLAHKPQQPNPKRYTLLSKTNKDYKNDGLSTLQYEVANVERHHLYTLIKANIDQGS